MAENEPIRLRIEEIARDMSVAQGVELVHTELRGAKRDSVVRIYIDREGGVGIEDCSRFSNAVEAVLDAEDLIPWAYTLEVSSPGIERALYSIADFRRFVGELAKVTTSEEIAGQKTFIGRIDAVEGNEIIFDDRTSGNARIPYDKVAKANLKLDLGKELKGR